MMNRIDIPVPSPGVTISADVQITCDRYDDAGLPVWWFELAGTRFEYHGPMIHLNGKIDETRVKFTPVEVPTPKERW